MPKKIIFDETAKIVQNRDWYEAGGYRSQHVVLTIAALANAVERIGKSVNFLAIWNQQKITPAMERALGQAADVAHDVLLHPGEGYRNISEWAKQPNCWKAVKDHEVEWDSEWLNELIGKEEAQEIEQEGRQEQREVNGIEAQTKVVEAGADFWKSVLNWCIAESEATEKERGILRCAAAIPSKIPSEKQSVLLVELMDRLRKDGCPYKLGRISRRSRVKRD